ncbi:hypothetical protein [Alkalicoccobacillus murimartini]|uniref:Cobalamin biosynthesis protein CobT n=1 Tax=Alkalicoccobacillus murimartini TaxID=171685 RepID=A0ABT9YFD5_9BACI|nr:hypothetical protein [Alkalicoccobacillus murimartini]MDQ0206554.1 cobalamin biosynthesis protein CobT [Alkalicoccobacillus murimartini]
MKKLLVALGLSTFLALSACNTDNLEGSNTDDSIGAQDDVSEEVVDASDTDSSSEDLEETTDVEESDSSVDEDEKAQPSDDDRYELYDSYQNEMDSVYYSLEELKAVLYVGMNYVTYLDETTGEFPILETFTDENTGDILDVFIANDGFLGVLNTPEEGIKNLISFHDMHEAADYFEE